ncbi:MAG: aldo/keto reductase [Chloroflexota bacterium]
MADRTGVDPFARVRLGRTSVEVTRLGFGAAPIGGLYAPVAEADAVATVRRAWDLGIRTFDVAPLYGYGLAERRVGLALRDLPRDAYTLSTKVGRLIVPRDRIAPDADVDRQALDGEDDWFYRGVDPVRPVWDYSGDGIRRSLEESLERLGLARVDIVYVHDPELHLEQALREAWPALERLRAEGTVGAIGFGVDYTAPLAWLLERSDPDVVLVAGRYTLLDQSSLDAVLPLCAAKDVSVVIGGVMNSGLLADPRPGATFDYAPAEAAIVARAQAIRAICDRHGVSIKAAAVRFVLAHPRVAAIVAGVRRIDHLEEYPALYRTRIPAALWTDLRAAGLLDPRAPVPDGA